MTRSTRLPLGTVLVGAWLVANADVAHAHIDLDYPTMRSTLSQKARHCGDTGSTRGNAVTTFRPGETITVRWTETINHPGYYRISFDLDGQDFTIPPAVGDTSANTNVLLDNIADGPGPTYSQQITLPNQECNNCTLQLIQVMTDKLPYTTDTNSNDIYFRCADIVLSNTATPDANPGTPDANPGSPDANPGTPDAAGGDMMATEGCGCSGGSTSTPLAGVLAVGLVALARGRRKRVC